LKAGGDCKFFVGDVSNDIDCQQFVDFTITSFGQIDCLVHNAGALDISKIENLTSENIQQVFQVNVIGPINLTQKFLPYLRKQKGKVIFVSSGASTKPFFGWSTYCCSKIALNRFAECLALEEKEITSISFKPGRVDTEMMTKIRNEGKEEMNLEDYQKFIENKEKNELLSSEEVAKVLAQIILKAPLSWSGKFISTDFEELSLL
jgi:NAD(P)-dependent dehydrogenase (short-subunit alcohol dehydrogenase family)